MSNFKAGFARFDVTPPFGICMQGYYNIRHAEGILDPLLASALAVSDGKKTAVVFSLDFIGINQTISDIARNVIAEKTGLPYEAIFLACTHTHTGPTLYPGQYPYDPEYNNVLYRKLADAAVTAINDLKDAVIETANGEVKDISFIRRYRMKNGKTQTNPGVGNPDIAEPIGLPDESLQLVKIKREAAPEILLVNFQVHPDVIGGSKFSADFPGFVRRSVESVFSNAYCIYFNGAQGDTNHINTDKNGFRGSSGYEHSRYMGLSITGSVMKIYLKTLPVDASRVDFCQNIIDVPANRGDISCIPLMEKYIELHEAGKYEEIPYIGMEYTTVVAEAYRIKALENGPDNFKLYLNAVRFGDVVISGIPGEPFTDIGRNIKENSPFKATFICCCANGCEGYYPMKSAYDEGGYEARSSSFKSGVAETIIDNSIDMLKKLY